MTTPQRLALTWRRLPLRGWMPYALFAAACGLSAAASWYVSATASAQREAEYIADQVKFESDAERTRQQIDVRLNTYIEVVRAAAALLGASSEINGAEFRAFVRGLQLRERYPGMVGIGFAPRVLHPNRREFSRAVSLDSVRMFRIRPTGVRPEYHPALFLEPIDSATRASIGFDLSTDPALSSALDQARDTGEPTASRLLNASALGPAGRNAFVLVIPVYRPGMPIETVDARRRWLRGFMFSPFRAEDVLDQLVTNARGLVSLEVYDGSNAEPTNLLRKSTVVRNRARFESKGSVAVAGRTWLVMVKSLDAPVRVEWQTANGTLLAGLVLSVLLFLITSAQVRAWETAARHETELRASAEALRESEAKAQAADRTKDEFLATLSHELRTPLNAILGWVTMLRRGSVREDRRAHGLAVIERNARLQTQLIEDLLDVSRIVLGKVRLQVGPLPVASVVSAVVESLRPSAEAKRIRLHTLGPTDSVVIRGDSDRMHQIIWNLVANAIKFTPAGGHVHVELSRDEHHARISVRDTGVGITAEFLPHVFERFRQADSSTTRPHTGIGIGLSIVHHLVELHGGSIEVRSDGRDRGAEFVLQFLIAPSTSEASGAALAGTSLPSAALIDDVAANLAPTKRGFLRFTS
jgi:signal transduction histidine kinase